MLCMSWTYKRKSMKLSSELTNRLIQEMNNFGFKGHERERLEWGEDKSQVRQIYETWDNKRLVNWIYEKIKDLLPPE